MREIQATEPHAYRKQWQQQCTSLGARRNAGVVEHAMTASDQSSFTTANRHDDGRLLLRNGVLRDAKPANRLRYRVVKMVSILLC
jgi:hypothetical protein